MIERARWLLLTHQGHVALFWIYAVVAATSVVVYAIARGPGYALLQAVLFTAAGLWMRFCLRRGAARGSARDEPAVDGQ